MLVTGGARGIGRSICQLMASEGAWVFPADVIPCDETVSLCKELGAQADSVTLNVTDSASAEQAIEAVRAKAGKIDVLVNNAGISRDALAIRMTDDQWNLTLSVNLTGSFYCARAAAKVMMKARRGAIVNIASVVGMMGNAGQAAYSASKAGMVGLTKTLARELAARNITVNAIAPGFITTDMTNALDEKVKAEHMSHIPLGRYGDPVEVARLVAFLASDDATYITGQVVGLNGGMYM